MSMSNFYNKLLKLASYLFRSLPISQQTKVSVKFWLFKNAGALFRHTQGYRSWEEYKQIIGSENQSPLPTPAGTLTSEQSSKKHILIIDATTPTPDRDAGSVTAFFFMKAFTELGYSVTFIPNDLLPKGVYTQRLIDLGVRCFDASTISCIDDFLEKEGCTLSFVFLYRVHVARLHFPSVKKYAPQAKIIFDTVDLHYLREERQAEIDATLESKRSAIYTKRAEFEMLKAADASIVLSEVERKIVLSQAPSVNLFNIPLLLDIPGRSAPFTKRRDIVFIGGFLHIPNVDAVTYFVNEIWPLIIESLTDINLIIIGSHPPADILAFESRPGVKVLGYVEDISQYFDRCRLAVAPLRFGAGIKGKIGTAASYGIPNVATSIAVEGMGMHHGTEVLVADEPRSFSESVIKLYSDEDLWNKLSQASIDFVTARYAYDAGKTKLRQLFNALESGIKANEIVETQEYRPWSTRYFPGEADSTTKRVVHNRGSFMADKNERGDSYYGYCILCHSPTSFDYKKKQTTRSTQALNNDAAPEPRTVCSNCGANEIARVITHMVLQEVELNRGARIRIEGLDPHLHLALSVSCPDALIEEAATNAIIGEDGHTLMKPSLDEQAHQLQSPTDLIISIGDGVAITDMSHKASAWFQKLNVGGSVLYSRITPPLSDNKISKQQSDLNRGALKQYSKNNRDELYERTTDAITCDQTNIWYLSDEMKNAGFEDVRVLSCYSEKFGYLSKSRIICIARKKHTRSDLDN